MENKTQMYSYSVGSKIFKLAIVLVLISIVMSLFSIEYFRSLPLAMVPSLIAVVALYKYFEMRKILSLFYTIDFDEESLRCGNITYDLKTMTTLNIQTKRNVEKFSIIYAKDGKEKKVVIDGRFPKYTELRNQIIEIGKKYDPNVYSLLKRQSM